MAAYCEMMGFGYICTTPEHIRHGRPRDRHRTRKRHYCSINRGCKEGAKGNPNPFPTLCTARYSRHPILLFVQEAADVLLTTHVAA